VVVQARRPTSPSKPPWQPHVSYHLLVIRHFYRIHVTSRLVTTTSEHKWSISSQLTRNFFPLSTLEVSLILLTHLLIDDKMNSLCSYVRWPWQTRDRIWGGSLARLL
jgi:hypothetical protein